MFIRLRQAERPQRPPLVELSDDVDLLRRTGANDSSAFERIKRRHNRLPFRRVRGVVAGDAEAQDVVQETYWWAFGARPSFRGDAGPGTWLARRRDAQAHAPPTFVFAGACCDAVVGQVFAELPVRGLFRPP
ncbi:sigma factor [Polaromonas jejuensis]|uniref:Sigma factor n=1 Tax=Polaromonas jejuensis TaxID=457502 RepID=A0ABW0QMB9_9BURK|nr:sigma factor [Polaromonas jejuensis]